MPDFTIMITNEVGLHARPLALFVKEANNFQSEVSVTNVTSGKGPSNMITGKKMPNNSAMMVAVTKPNSRRPRASVSGMILSIDL